jgi:hypothetical protein
LISSIPRYLHDKHPRLPCSFTNRSAIWRPRLRG